ncbi:DUF4139 domain-containing protein [uncultured Sphingomonas sp.]|uniref:DUF4139 domain-containing protein n=1 Tax=uncultured Sphingomonas sp. TaxID=158754 RepID=UPI0035C98CB0
MRALALAALCLADAAAGQGTPAVATSAAPAQVAVTVYRNPSRARAAPIDLRYLGGFALVTETRRVRLPRGRATLRFEGVAEGIVPVSAIVDGLPGGTVEKNRDARLLSPASLVDGTLGRTVTLTRTDRATGRIRSEEATIVAGPLPGVVLRTTAGIETLRCSGLAEALRFDAVPPGLSAKPVLSVTTDTPTARDATVTLSYLTSGFDWSASYVATIAPDGRTLDLFAWLTLANANPEAFPAAQVQAVAGRLNRSGFNEVARRAGELRLTCFPLGTTTSDLREKRFEHLLERRDEADDYGEIVVTASRAMAVAAPAPPEAPPPPEDLGDLKLYRVPERVTVAPRAQKQVALLARAAVPFERRYRLPIQPGRPLTAEPTRIVLVVRNTTAGGLGLALPTGSTALYADRPGGRLLLGTGTIADRAEGETVRLESGVSRQVLIDQRVGRNEATITATNANPFAITLELPIGAAGQKIEGAGDPLPRIDGIATWTATLPPNGRAELAYRF